MTPPSVDVKDLLVAAGLGTFAATSGWGIYVGSEPPTPDTCITIYDTGGPAPQPRAALDMPDVQVRVRGASDDYLNAWDKANVIKNTLLGSAQQTVNSKRVGGFLATSDVAFIARDEGKNRPIFTVNFRFMRQPTTVQARPWS